MTYRYFHIAQGLRGCYMPDSIYCIRVKTRRELKAALESEAYYIRDAEMIGCSKRAVTWLAAIAWRKSGEYVAPYRDKQQNYYPYGLFCSQASKADYLEYCESEEM